MRVLRLLAAMISAGVSTCTWAASCDGFVDVDSTASYCNAVTYVKSRGVTLGCTDTTHYCPADYVTRAQMALFLQRTGQADTTNTLGDHTTAIGGGTNNGILTSFGTIGGGTSNAINGIAATIGGGSGNTAVGSEAVIGGGFQNTTGNGYATVAGGVVNTANGYASTVPGGNANFATGDFSFATGHYANAALDGCTVFADDSTASDTTCSAANQFMVRALGGVVLITGGTADANYTGAQLAAGSGSWTTYSDRAGKDAVIATNPLDVLARVSAIPVATWHYKAQDPSIRHMGPMAQDFYAAFGLGETERGISVVDAQGVALAAIQGLNAKVDARDAQLGAQASQLSAQAAQIEALRAVVANLAAELAALQQQ